MIIIIVFAPYTNVSMSANILLSYIFESKNTKNKYGILTFIPFCSLKNYFRMTNNLYRLLNPGNLSHEHDDDDDDKSKKKIDVWYIKIIVM